MKRHEYQHLYSGKRWKLLRRLQLSSNPLCFYCEQAGYLKAANVVDHIEPHRGNDELFYSESNLRSLCTPCHNRLASVKDRKGFAPGHGGDGVPIDADHPWHNR